MAIRLDTAALVSIFTEGVLYGLFVLLFMVSTIVLLQKRSGTSTGKINVTLLWVSVIMFILATLHAAVNLSRLLEAFIFSGQSADDYLLAAIPTPLFVLKNTIYVLQTLIGDGFLLYRLYLIWNRHKVVFVPILLCFISSIGVGIGMLQSQGRADPQSLIFVSSLGQWLVAFFSLTLFTDLSCTVLIAYRIWSIHSQTRGIVHGPSLFPAIIIIVESGAVYSLCVAILLGLYISGSYAHKIFLDAVTQLIGVVFSVIIVRVGLGISAENDQARLRLDTLFLSSPRGSKRHSNMGPVTLRPISSPPAAHFDEQIFKSDIRDSPSSSYPLYTPELPDKSVSLDV